MMAAISGNLKSTKLLLEKLSPEAFSKQSIYGESPLYFALKHRRWDYLIAISKWCKLTPKDLELNKKKTMVKVDEDVDLP